jgi:hypothetical protein
MVVVVVAIKEPPDEASSKIAPIRLASGLVSIRTEDWASLTLVWQCRRFAVDI